MKKQGHPPYQDVLFVDTSTGSKFIIGTTLQPKEREMYEGKEYPLCRLATSSFSHPFFTKSNQFVDAEGRVDRFSKRYAKKREEQAASLAAKDEAEEAAKKAKKKKK